MDYKQIEMGEKETSSAAPYTSSAKRTSSPSSLCVRTNATVRGEGERLGAYGNNCMLGGAPLTAFLHAVLAQ